MCGSKGSAPTPSSASTTTAGSSSGQSATNFAQGPTPATGQRYEDFLNKVTSLASSPFNPATLSQVAPLTDYQNQGLDQMFNLGMTMGDFQPEKVQEIMSPYIQNVVETSQDWFNNQNKIAANNLLSQGIRSGNAFGGDRSGVAAAELGGQQQLAQAPVIAGLYQSGYGQALNEYNTLKQFGIQGAGEAVKAGTVQQAQQQREMDVATANALQQEGYPFQVANWQGAALGGIGPLTGTVGQSTTTSSANTSGVSNPPTPNPLTQALGIGSSLIGLGSSVNLSQPTLTQPATDTASGGVAGFGKHGGRVGSLPQRFAYGGQTNNFEDETSYAGYGHGDDGGGMESYGSNDDSSNNKKDDEEEEREAPKKPLDVVEAAQRVGEQKPQKPEPLPSPTGEFKVVRKAQPYVGVRIPGYGTPGSVPQSATPQASGGGGGSNFGATAGRVAGGALGSMFGPFGTLIGGAAGGALGGSMFGKDGGRVPYYEDGDTVDFEDTLDTGNMPVRMASLDVTPRTGNPDTLRVSKWNDRPAASPVVREIPTEPPAEGTGIVPPTRPSIPTPDPLAPYLGTSGPRSVTGPARGSTAGNLPYQAREVSPNVLVRERVQRELEDNPRLARTFDANTTAEVGRGARARQGYQAATIDRAIQEGKPLGALVNNPNYYPLATRMKTATSGQGVDESIWAGANPVNYGTGNASYDPNKRRHVGFAGGPQTASIGAERYGIEGQAGLPFARARGYTGPDRTAIGFGPGAPVGSQGTMLAGGPNTTGDVEVSAQARRTPPSPPGGDPTNYGYGPGQMKQIPGAPPRDFGQRWAVNPFTQAGIAMLRSQSPYFATGLGEGLAGAAGALEHTREQQVLDSKPVLRTEFPTFMWQYGDGRLWDSGMPNPGYDAKSVPRDRLKWEMEQGKKAQWKATGYTHPESGSDQYYDANTGRFGWSPPTIPGAQAPGPLITDVGGGKPAVTQQPPTTQQPPPTTQQPPPTKPAVTGTVIPGPIPGRATPSTSAAAPFDVVTKIDPGDPLIPGAQGVYKRPNPGVLTSRENAYKEVMKDARQHSAGADGAVAQLNRLEAELSKLPKGGLLAAGPGAEKRNEIARWINYTRGLLGMPPAFDEKVVGAIEASFKDSVVGGFMQSRLTGGGQHNAAPIIQMAIKAFPGAEMTTEGAKIIIAANKQAAQRERDRYAFFNDPDNLKLAQRDPDQLTAAFDRYNPVEMYAARARMSLIPQADIDWYKQNPEKRAAGFDKTHGVGLREWIR